MLQTVFEAFVLGPELVEGLRWLDAVRTCLIEI